MMLGLILDLDDGFQDLGSHKPYMPQLEDSLKIKIII